MIFGTSLPRVQAFFGETTVKGSDLACSVLFLCSFVAPLARRSVTSAARSVLEDARNAGWLLRWLGSSNAPQALLAAAQKRLTDAAASKPGLHVLAIDSTQHGQQGQQTENTFSCGNTNKRDRKSDRHQNKVHRKSAHLFVFALLLTPAGVRVPYWLPFYTEDFCEATGRKHLTQADLAARLIEAVDVPEGSEVIVAGDTAFEAKQVRKACAKRGWSWVVPLNPERVLAGAKPRPKVRTLYEHLKAEDFVKVSFRLDRGELAPLARVSPSRSKSSKHARTYWAHKRTQDILNIGEVALLFSMLKDPTVDGVKVQKVLISDRKEATAEQMLLWYSLRWQVELFFRECKSDLGMCQYKLGRFRRVVGWVNLGVLAFCYLEWLRFQKEQEVAGRGKAKAEEVAFLRRLRTAGLKDLVRRHAGRAEVEALLLLAASEQGRDRLNALLQALHDDGEAADA